MGRIVIMRLAALLMFFIPLLPLSALQMEGTPDARSVSGDSFSISFPSMRISLEAGPLSVGEIDRRGLVRTISDIHEGYSDLRLEAHPFHSDGRRYGAVLDLGPLSIGFSLNDRALAAASLSFEGFSVAVLHASEGGAEETFLEDRKDSVKESVLYGAASFSWRMLSGTGLFSFSPDLGFDGFASIALRHDDYSIVLSMGSPPVLYDDSTRFMYSLSGSIGEDGFRSEFSFRTGNAPVFTGDFLPYEADLRSRLSIHGVTVRSSMEFSFTKKGSSHKRDRFTVEAYGIRLGFDSGYGLIAVYDGGAVEFGYDEGRLYAELGLEMWGARSRVKVRLSSDSIMDVYLSLDL